VIVLSDTSPINYLILLGYVDILPALFGRIIIPRAVHDELLHSGTPEAVRRWIDNPPPWLEVRSPSHLEANISLGQGEIEAISLAMEIHADLLLMDDRVARRTAENRGLSVVGTLNVLGESAARGFLDLSAALDKLRQTNFHVSKEILDKVLALDAERRKRQDETH
jgi:predicted nucleic acid-binding protein